MVPQNDNKPVANAISIQFQSVESSIQNLTKRWQRRQKWDLFFNPQKEQGNLNINKAAWRTNMAKFLESTPVTAITILLLFVDLVLTILELSSSLLSCSSPQKNHYRIWYHWLGIAILILLSAKAVGLAVGLGSSFCRRPGYVVDGAVVIGALILEALVEKKGGGLLVVVCFWRVVRVVESAFELSDEAIEAQIEEIGYQFEILKQENTKLLAIIAEKDIIIQNLEEIIEKIESK